MHWLKTRVIVRELDNIRVKGKNKPVLIYELIDCIEGYDIPEPQIEKVKKGHRVGYISAVLISAFSLHPVG